MQEGMRHLLVGIQQQLEGTGDMNRISEFLRSLALLLSEMNDESCPNAACSLMQSLLSAWEDLLTHHDFNVVTCHRSERGSCLAYHLLTLGAISGMPL